MKILLLLSLSIFTLFTNAQTQKGYVKTKGRMNSAGKVIPGKRLAGAVISVKGKNAVTTNGSGDFTLKLSGNNYVLSNVRKQGYELTDIDALSKQYTYSAQNPHIIVMETSADKIDEQLMIEEKMRANLNRRIKKQQTEIANLKTANKISQEQYRKLMLQLNEERNSNEKLIQDMVERYSKIDYDQLDAFNQEINRLILEGELTKADSLLSTKGDINSRIKTYQDGQKLINEEQKKLDRAKELSQKELTELGEDCYKKFEIFKLRHQNDSAAHYIELRASLDTTNVEWQLEAGFFIDNYLAQYNKAMSYYQKALNTATHKHGEKHSSVALGYNNIGGVYNLQGNYDKALEYYSKALHIFVEILGEKHTYVALSYNNIGSLYNSQGNYSKALEYHNKALHIRLEVLGEEHPDVALSYNNIGTVYNSQGDYDKALVYYNKALNIQLKILGEKHPDIATSYNNIGTAYDSQGIYDKALEYHYKAQTIRLDNFGKIHPDVALGYNNIGTVYNSQGYYDKALEYYNKALNILVEVLGERHPSVATNYNNIGAVHNSQGNNDKALEYYNKALEIRLEILGEKHPDVALSYNNIGTVYNSQGDYDKALEYSNKALSIRLAIRGEKHPNVAESYNNIGTVYFRQNNYDKAIVFYNKALGIQLKLLGDNHPDVAMSYNNIGTVYAMQKNYEKALEYFNKALTIRLTILGEKHPDVATTYNNIGYVHFLQKDYEKTLKFYNKALNILLELFGEKHPSVTQSYSNIGFILYTVQKDWESFSKFLPLFAYTATIVEEDSPAAKLGLKGEYYLLEFADWNQESTSFISDKITEYKGKPKHILLLRDGKISQHYFEDAIGAQLSPKYVGKEEKLRITEAYNKWKASLNTTQP